MSKRAGVSFFSHAIASASTTAAPVAFRSSILARRSRTTLPEFSTKTVCAAPRDNASRPSAPVPANRSRQRVPSTTGASQLNRVSRILPAVGRNPGLSATGKRRPRHFPATIRSRPDGDPRAPRFCFFKRLVPEFDRVGPTSEITPGSSQEEICVWQEKRV